MSVTPTVGLAFALPLPLVSPRPLTLTLTLIGESWPRDSDSSIETNPRAKWEEPLHPCTPTPLHHYPNPNTTLTLSYCIRRIMSPCRMRTDHLCSVVGPCRMSTDPCIQSRAPVSLFQRLGRVGVEVPTPWSQKPWGPFLWWQRSLDSPLHGVLSALTCG